MKEDQKIRKNPEIEEEAGPGMKAGAGPEARTSAGDIALYTLLKEITSTDETAREAARRHWSRVAKPIGSLGLLETALEDIAALTGSPEPDLSEKAVVVFCGDNGVTAQGVSQVDSSVTAACARQLALRRTSVCRMAETAHCRVLPVDMGILDYPEDGCSVGEVLEKGSGFLSCRIRNGTADFTGGPAMRREEAEQAVLAGIRVAREASDHGIRLLAAGELGIGNTTTASAVTSVLLQLPPEQVTGRGAGLSDQGLERKLDAIRRGIALNKPDPADPLDILCKVGGLDLAGMCGLYLGGALCRVPVLADGFPSLASALLAVRICPAAGKAVFASHVSTEPAATLLLDALGKKPLISAGMHLGEGTGAVAAMPLLAMAESVYRSCYTFEEGGIAQYVPQ